MRTTPEQLEIIKPYLTAKNKVYTTVNFAMVEAYCECGKQIAEVQGERAEWEATVKKNSLQLSFIQILVRAF